MKRPTVAAALLAWIVAVAFGCISLGFVRLHAVQQRQCQAARHHYYEFQAIGDRLIAVTREYVGTPRAIHEAQAFAGFLNSLNGPHPPVC